MCPQSPTHRRTRNPAHLSTAPRSTEPRIILLETDGDLFCWLWSQLRELEPKATFNACLDPQLEELAAIILRKDRHSAAPLSWPQIFSEVRWQNPSQQHGCRYSLNLLMAVGRMCDVLNGEWGGGLSPFSSCEIMLQQWDMEGAYIHRTNKRDGITLTSTADCERRFGVRVRVEQEDLLFDDFDWDRDAPGRIPAF